MTDIATGDLLAAPRFDEPHRWIPEGTHWVSSGTYALFVWDLEPEELEGVMVRVEANLVTRGDEAFSDARLVRLTAGD